MIDAISAIIEMLAIVVAGVAVYMHTDSVWLGIATSCALGVLKPYSGWVRKD